MNTDANDNQTTPGYCWIMEVDIAKHAPAKGIRFHTHHAYRAVIRAKTSPINTNPPPFSTVNPTIATKAQQATLTKSITLMMTSGYILMHCSQHNPKNEPATTEVIKAQITPVKLKSS